MKVPINLASQPYENLRPLYFASGMAVVLLIVLSLGVVWKVRQNRDDTRTLTARSAQIEKDLGNLRGEQQELVQWLARPEVLEIRDKAAFLNSLIVRKSLSWTQMFMDLEKILPERVQITTIRPSLDESQRAKLNLTVAAGSVQPLIEFLKDLESAPQFGSPVVESQRFPAEKATDANILLDLSVLYHQAGEVPSPSPPEPPKEATAGPSAALADVTPDRLAPQPVLRLPGTPLLPKGER